MDPDEDFSALVKVNGGNEELVEILKGYGFTSKVSVAFLNIESDDGREMISHLTLGHKCCLQALVGMAKNSLCKADSDQNVYTSATKQSFGLADKPTQSLKSRLGQLFGFDHAKKPEGNDEDVSLPKFQPSSQSTRRGLKRSASERSQSPLRKGKGKFPKHSVPTRRKIKVYRLKVVMMPTCTMSVPSAKEKATMTKEVWIRTGANEEEVCSKIKTAFDLQGDEHPTYMYAQGKNLKVAELEDIENADSWDLDTVRALMGRGDLYAYVDRPVVDEDVKGNSPSSTSSIDSVSFFLALSSSH